MKTLHQITTSILLVALFFGVPSTTFAQVDPNQSIYNTAASDNSTVNTNASNQNQTIFNGTQSSSNQSYNQGVSDNNTVNWKAQSTTNSLPSGSIYNQWINSQSSAANTSVNTSAANSNNTINKDIFNPNQSYTDVNTGLYNAGQAANQKATSAGSTCKLSFKKFNEIFISMTCIINNFLIAIALSFATLYFVWGVVQYVLSADSVEERKKSKQVMLWGVIALFAAISVWGIIAAARTLFGV